MPNNWSQELQTAIYLRLASYTALSSLVQIYDYPPQQSSSFPYITIGDSVLNENNTDSNLGVNVLLTIHIWSDQPNRDECKSIQALLVDALARYDLALSGFTLITCELDSESSFLDADGVTQHGQSTFLIQFE